MTAWPAAEEDATAGDAATLGFVSAASFASFAPGESVAFAPRSVLLRDTGLVRVGTFRAHPGHPGFAHAGQHLATPEFVFPRRAVRIHRDDRHPFVADANRVVFYNPGDHYERSAVDPNGDRCEWFGVAASAIVDVQRGLPPATSRTDGRAAVRPDRAGPFERAVASADLASYLIQRRLVSRVLRHDIDDLALDEAVLGLLHRVLTPQGQPRRGLVSKASAPLPRGAGGWVATVQEIFAERAVERWTLAQLGAAVGASPFALCRAFRALTGESLHRYQSGLRLRLALERLADPYTDLSELAGDLGYSSHSHFTAAFRQGFGLTPAQFRGVLRRAPVRRSATY